MIIGLSTILGALLWIERDRFETTWRIRSFLDGGDPEAMTDRSWRDQVPSHRVKGQHQHRYTDDVTGTFQVSEILARNGRYIA